MPQALVLAPILLAAVFTFSAVAKLRDRSSVDRAFTDLQVPAPLAAPWIRRVFPWAELALGLALLLVPWPLSVPVAVAALVLAAVYWWLIATAFRRPDPVSCGCFGSVAPDKVDAVTVARNTTLVLVAVLALVDAVNPTPILVRLYTTEAGWWLLGFLVAAWLGYAILRPGTAVSPAAGQPASVHVSAGARPEGGAGAAAESDGDLAGIDEYVRLPIPFGGLQRADGSAVTLRDLSRERPQLLIWLSLTCGSCQDVLAELPSWRGTLGPVEVRPVLWSLDGVAEQHPELGDVALSDHNYEVQRLFDLSGTPSAVLLGADGLVAGGPVVGSGAVRAFVADIREELREASVLDGAAPGTGTVNGLATVEVPEGSTASERPRPAAGPATDADAEDWKELKTRQ